MAFLTSTLTIKKLFVFSFLLPVGVTPGASKLVLYIAITQLLLPCWIREQPQAPQWCISWGGCFGSLTYLTFVLKLSMLQGITTYLADNIARLHEPLHLKGFSYLLGNSSSVANISAASHLSFANSCCHLCFHKYTNIP